jgi:hypothetical protein
MDVFVGVHLPCQDIWCLDHAIISAYPAKMCHRVTVSTAACAAGRTLHTICEPCWVVHCKSAQYAIQCQQSSWGGSKRFQGDSSSKSSPGALQYLWPQERQQSIDCPPVPCYSNLATVRWLGCKARSVSHKKCSSTKRQQHITRNATRTHTHMAQQHNLNLKCSTFIPGLAVINGDGHPSKSTQTCKSTQRQHRISRGATQAHSTTQESTPQFAAPPYLT